jgi:hypothetical protein
MLELETPCLSSRRPCCDAPMRTAGSREPSWPDMVNSVVHTRQKQFGSTLCFTEPSCGAMAAIARRSDLRVPSAHGMKWAFKILQM